MIDIKRLKDARDKCMETVRRVKSELHAVAVDPKANRASLEVYRGEYREAREYYDQLVSNNAEAMIAEIEAARYVIGVAEDMPHDVDCMSRRHPECCDCYRHVVHLAIFAYNAAIQPAAEEKT